jgi:hypothetical protein
MLGVLLSRQNAQGSCVVCAATRERFCISAGQQADMHSGSAQPALLLWADGGMSLGKPLTHGLKRWVPSLELHYMPRCGRWVQNQAAAEVSERMMVCLRTQASHRR